MDIQFLKNHIASSPAFVLDADEINKALNRLAELRNACGCKILYSIKALPFSTVLEPALTVFRSVRYLKRAWPEKF